MESLSENIGLRLQIARKTAGYKRAKNFADKHGIPLSTYTQYEKGKRSLTAESLMKYGNLLHINPSWLLTGKSHPCPAPYYDKSRKSAIEAGLMLLKKQGIVFDEEFPTISAEETETLINMKLFKEILLEVASLLTDQKIGLDKSDLVDFCIDIYNNVRSLTCEEENWRPVIQLSIRSLTKLLKTTSQAREVQT
jgi:transcriptional regulator with XRE-family HTH domain